MARLLLSLFKLRDAALPEGDPRDRFDKAYQAVTAPLLDARARVKKIGALWEDHVRRVQAGEAARVRGHAIHVDENVDHELGQEADGFLNAAVRAGLAGSGLLKTLDWIDRVNQGDLVGLRSLDQLSNRLLARPDCRMMLESVPVFSSEWSGTGTVVVVSPDRFCMTT